MERTQQHERARAAGQNPPPLTWPRRYGKRRKPLSETDRHRIQAAADARRAAASHVGSDGAKAAAYVAEVVAATGAGPLWSELRRVMGWPGKPALERILEGLRQAGWVTYSDEVRSLRPGPSWQGAPQ